MLSADVDAVARKLLIIAREGLSHTKHQNVMRISVLRWFLMWPQVRPQGPPIASHGRAHACGQYHPAVLWFGSAGARVLEARVPLQRRPAVGALLPHHGRAMEVGRARHSLGRYGVLALLPCHIPLVFSSLVSFVSRSLESELWFGSAGARVLETRVPLQRRYAVGALFPHYGREMEAGRARHSLGGYGVSRMVLLLI